MTRRNRSPRLVVAALILAASVPAMAEKGGRHDFDPEFDFIRLQTYDFRVHPSRQRETALALELLPRLEALLDEVLGAKGYRRDSDAPDFVVMFDGHLAEIMIPDDGVYVDISNYVVWTVPGRGQAGSSKGLLAVRMMLPGEKEPFWWAADDARIDGKITTAKVWKKAEPVARRIVGRFPAQGVAPAAPTASSD